MKAKPRAFARSAAQVMTAAVVGAGSVFFVATAAQAAPPTVTSVVVSGTTSKVVTAGTVVTITGVGYTGMTDNMSATGCPATPVTTTACSEVRFVGQTGTYTNATRFTVLSDTTIQAVVPSGIPNTVDTTTASAPVPGTGSMKVQVVNTMAGGTSSLGSLTTGTASEVFYRAKLNAAMTPSAVTLNPIGGGTLVVDIASSPIAALTSGSSGTFVAEKITAYLVSTVANSPRITATSVTFNDADSVNVIIPPGSVSSESVNVILVHDGIAGDPDGDTTVKYPAVITKIEGCSVDVSTVPSPLPTCSGTANLPTSGTANVKVTGKGFTGSSAWSFDGSDGTIVEDCETVADTMAFCNLTITTAPTSGVAAVTFTADDPDNAANPTVAATGGAIVVYTGLV